jgi:Cd2+/Zn2+-exporting ATPase
MKGRMTPLNQEFKRMLARIGASTVLLLFASLIQTQGGFRFLLYFPPYLIIGWDILWRAVLNIKRGQVFDENFLMSLATVGAFGIGEYPEAVFVMIFYQVGELFQRRAVEKSRDSICTLMNIMPEYVNLDEGDHLRQVQPEEVEVGQLIMIKPGEKVPLDGVIVEGSSTLNTMALTGEAAPRDIGVGDDLVSGCVNLTGLLRVRVTHRFEDSTVSKILDLVENASANKAKTESFITRFAKYYTPSVVIAAVCIAIIPSLIWGNWSEWIYKALSFLVISCPCALVLSIPLSFFGGIGGASRRGILVKGATYLEALAHSEIVALDKTGTLTKGVFSVCEIVPQSGWSKEALLLFAAQAEAFSDHPIAESLRKALPEKSKISAVAETKVLAGKGIQAVIDGKNGLVGNATLMEEAGIVLPVIQKNGTIVHVATDHVYAGYILIKDEVKSTAATTISKLHDLGIRKTVLLTGDNKTVAEGVASELGLDEVCAKLLPQDKVSVVESLIEDTSSVGSLVFVGDGINDAPVLARADVGIAMGAFGSDAAIEAADVVLMDDDPMKICTAIQIAKKTVRIARENIVFSLGIKGLVLILSVLGLSNMWQAILADVGVSVVAILNATRTLYTKA